MNARTRSLRSAYRMGRSVMNNRMAAEPSESLQETVRRFNLAFGQRFDVNADYSRITLQNMATHALDTHPEISLLLTRHAEISERIV